MPDPRAELRECELCDDNSEFRPGAACPPSAALPPAADSNGASPDAEIEALVQKLTDEILRQLTSAAGA